MRKLFGYNLLKDKELKDLKEKAKENTDKNIKICEWVYRNLERFQEFSCYPYAMEPPYLKTAENWSKWIIRQKRKCVKRIAELKNCKIEDVKIREIE